MQDDPRTLIPRDKFDTQRAAAAVAAGYPATAPILADLLEWIRDGNWPVAQILAPFLATIGAPLVPHIRTVLATNDGLWKYWTLTDVVQRSPEVAAGLREDLLRCVNHPTPDEAAEGVDEIARRILRDDR